MQKFNYFGCLSAEWCLGGALAGIGYFWYLFLLMVTRRHHLRCLVALVSEVSTEFALTREVCRAGGTGVVLVQLIHSASLAS